MECLPACLPARLTASSCLDCTTEGGKDQQSCSRNTTENVVLLNVRPVPGDILTKQQETDNPPFTSHRDCPKCLCRSQFLHFSCARPVSRHPQNDAEAKGIVPAHAVNRFSRPLGLNEALKSLLPASSQRNSCERRSHHSPSLFSHISLSLTLTPFVYGYWVVVVACAGRGVWSAVSSECGSVSGQCGNVCEKKVADKARPRLRVCESPSEDTLAQHPQDM
ncbi:hypothetical protein Q8A73_006100 [Channa argus]|nr:hypothetical protein Q8A73_006100 [Channa argus]